MYDKDYVFDLESEEIEHPFLRTYKKVYKSLIKKIIECDVKNKEEILERIREIVFILIDEGDTCEDVVVNTAQLFVFLKQTKSQTSFISDLASEKLLECVKILLGQKNQSQEEYLKNIFENQKYLFLAKIKASEIIETLRNNECDLTEKLVAQQERDIILKKYQNHFNKNLFDILKNLE